MTTGTSWTTGTLRRLTLPRVQPRPLAGLGDQPVADSVRRRLEPITGWDWQGWAATAWVAAIAALLRLVHLGTPSGIIFDEVYYANEGKQLFDHGVEWKYPGPLNVAPGVQTDTAGNLLGPGQADFVVHPPLGKWIIGVGEKLFGYNAFGWRIMSAIFGIILVIIVTRIARRMFRSTVLGAAAGLLVALDGMEFVLSRTGILDIFLATFIFAAFGCLIVDRDHRRVRWLRELSHGLDPTLTGRIGRPRFAIPWWRLLGAVMIGMACGVKWSAVWYLPLYLLLVYLFEVGARRTVSAAHPWRDALLDEGGWLVAMGAIAFVVYLASWTGWFLTDTGWDRHDLLNHGHHEYPIIGALQNLWTYHVAMYKASLSITSSHPYQSWPWQWLLLGRPVSFYWGTDPTCGAANCAAEVLLLGTPVLWWSFIPAIVGTVYFGISRRDWRAWALLAGALLSILPWFDYEPKHRTMFYFYAMPAEPFLVLAVVYCLGCLINRHPGTPGRTDPEDRRLYGTVFAGTYILLVALCFWYFHPIYVGDSIPYPDWLNRMWLGNRWV